MLTPNNTMPLTITDDQGVERRLHAIDFGQRTAYLYATDIHDAREQTIVLVNSWSRVVTALG